MGWRTLQASQMPPSGTSASLGAPPNPGNRPPAPALASPFVPPRCSPPPRPGAPPLDAPPFDAPPLDAPPLAELASSSSPVARRQKPDTQLRATARSLQSSFESHETSQTC